MTERRDFTGEVLDEQTQFTLRQVCRILSTGEETVIQIVREGIVEPAEPGRDAWTFTGSAIGRIQTVLRLQRDLEINLAGAALVIELLDEIEALRRRLGA